MATTTKTLTDAINAKWMTRSDLIGYLDFSGLAIVVEMGIPKRLGNSRKDVLVAALVASAATRPATLRELRIRGVTTATEVE